MKKNNFNIRIYYEDTDFGGIVYYANYLKFAERGRTEYLRNLGIIQTELFQKQEIYFVVRKCEINFISPAKLDDLILVETSITKISKASIVMNQEIILENRKLCDLQVKIACVDKNMKPVAIPADIVKLFEN